MYLDEHPESSIQDLWCTVEPQNLVQKAYPEVVDQFISKHTKRKPEKAKKKRKQAETSLNNLSDLMDALPKVTTKKKSRKVIAAVGVPSIQQFFKPKEVELEIPSDFSDCDENETFSEVLNEIVQRKPDLKKIGSKELFYDEVPLREQNTSTPSSCKYLLEDSILRRVQRKSYKPDFSDSFDHFLVDLGDNLPAVNQEVVTTEKSFFFEKLNDSVCDLFETSLNELIGFNNR